MAASVIMLLVLSSNPDSQIKVVWGYGIRFDMAGAGAGVHLDLRSLGAGRDHAVDRPVDARGGRRARGQRLLEPRAGVAGDDDGHDGGHADGRRIVLQAGVGDGFECVILSWAQYPFLSNAAIVIPAVVVAAPVAAGRLGRAPVRVGVAVRVAVLEDGRLSELSACILADAAAELQA